MPNFNDPLDALIKKHEAAANGETVEKQNETIVPQVPVPPVPDQIILPTSEPAQEQAKPPIDIDYGDNDLEAEIAAEEKAEQEPKRRVTFKGASHK